MQVRWQCIREFFSLALDVISNNNNNNNKSLFHQKIELLILCYNNTEDYNMEDILLLFIIRVYLGKQFKFKDSVWMVNCLVQVS